MKATGIVRRVDDLGRVAIPKEIRQTLKIKEGDILELWLDKDTVYFKKYNVITQIEEMAKVINDMDERNAHYYDKFMQEWEAFADADTIAEALYNAGYRKQSEGEDTNVPTKWISVEERLPSEGERRDEYGELVPLLVVEKDTQYPYRAFYDGTEWGDGLMKIRGITHWMPLPDAPKENEDTNRLEEHPPMKLYGSDIY